MPSWTRLLEQRSGLGTTWMSARPSAAAGTVFPLEDYTLGIRWWLGAPLIDAPGTCPGCSLPVETTGDHFLCCKRINFATRHDAVQDALFTILSSAGQSVQKDTTTSPRALRRPSRGRAWRALSAAGIAVMGRI